MTSHGNPAPVAPVSVQACARAFARARAIRSGQARLVGGLADQDRAGVADQPFSVRGDLQGMVPPVMLHDEERSGLEITECGNR
ncbi:MAG TPA: hypothetical protein VGG75_41710 [Trebonia sp.]|jgi:hypothetical protein